MPSVAVCPQCNHELLIPEGTGAEAWAKCPACQAMFQLPDAAQRQVPALLLVDHDAASAAEGSGALPPSNEPLVGPFAGFSSAETVADFKSVRGGEPDANGTQHRARVDRAEQREDDIRLPESETVIDPEQEETHATDEPEWSAPFADTVSQPAAESDVGVSDPPGVGSKTASGDGEQDEPTNQSDESIDADPGTEVVADEAASEPGRPTWDDAEQMERLLASVEPRPVTDEAAGRGAAAQPPDNPAAAADEALPRITPRGDGSRRKRSPARRLVGIAVGGLVGTALACYILLWIRGPDGDVFEVARYIPSAILPASFQQAPSQLAADRSPPADESAEVAARFDAPVADESGQRSVATGGSSDDDFVPNDERMPIPSAPPHDDASVIAGLEPREFDEPDAAPIADQAAVVRDAPPYPADALAAALDAARDAQPGLIQGSLNDEQAVRTKAVSYAMMCELADAVTFADEYSQPHEVAALRQDAETLFRETLSDPRTRSEVARITTKWLDWPERRQNGVFLAGTVLDRTVRGAVVEFQLDTEAGATLIVLVPAATADAEVPGAPVTVVGSIIEHPTERIAGYDGSARRAVWTEKLIPLEQ